MRTNKSAAILWGFILTILCILGIFLAGASGLAFWGWRSFSQPAGGGTPILATPVRPAFLTPSPAPEIFPEETMDPTEIFSGATETNPASSTSAELAAPAEVETNAPPSVPDPSCIPLNNPSARAVVLRVIDGVTIEVEENGQVYEVRYIGAALADSAEDAAIWTRATEKNASIVAGKPVLLIRDRTEQDGAGRRPRYVLVNSVFVNLEMVRSGYAIAAHDPPDLSCSALMLEAERQAVTAARGLWVPDATATRTLIPLPAATIATTGPLTIVNVAKRGSIWQEPEEYVEIRNDSREPLQLQDWTLHDNERHLFVFPSFVLGSGQYCRVYTNEYHPRSCGFSYYSPSPIWENDTDCAYLKDPYGTLISEFCYGFQ